MKEIEMIKAFAKLDGTKIMRCFGGDYFCEEGDYDPLTDLALNCAARDKHKIKIDYDNQYVSCHPDWSEFSIEVSFRDQTISKAVIECIIRAGRLWKQKKVYKGK